METKTGRLDTTQPNLSNPLVDPAMEYTPIDCLREERDTVDDGMAETINVEGVNDEGG